MKRGKKKSTEFRGIIVLVSCTLINFKFLSSDRDAGEFCPVEKVISKIIILRTIEHQSVLYLI